MITLRGIPAAPGLAIGQAHWHRMKPHSPPSGTAEPPETERQRLQKATEAAQSELVGLIAQTRILLGEDPASVFEAHLLMLEDPSLHDAILQRIEAGVSSEAAVAEAVDAHASQLEALENPLFGARAADVREVGDRLIRALMGSLTDGPLAFPPSSILLARDLTLSDLIRVDKERALGWCTEEGSPDSHAAILAAALGVPAVVGLGQTLRRVRDGETLAIDGDLGAVSIRPDAETQRNLETRRSRFLAAQARAKPEAQRPAMTQDGHRIPILANLFDVASASTALSHGADGVGLLRTEFLFLDKPLIPVEEEQVSAYTAILEAMGTRPVAVRTVDLGGDKWPPFLARLQPAHPSAPRGIGLSLKFPAFLKIQLRALLRAAAGRDVGVLLPLVTSLEEVQGAKALLEECREELESEGRLAARTVPIGVMVEVPAAVEIAENLAGQANFLSLGTNDLIPRLLDSDRTKGERRDPLDPIVLRALRRVVEAGHSAGIRVAVCGELAADPETVPLLVGLGLDELSMRPTAIPAVKARIRSLDRKQAEALAQEALQLSSAAEIRSLLNQS